LVSAAVQSVDQLLKFVYTDGIGFTHFGSPSNCPIDLPCKK
jgi:hypothetical protein